MCFSVNHENHRRCISPLKHLVKCILAVTAETLEKSFSNGDFERGELENARENIAAVLKADINMTTYSRVYLWQLLSEGERAKFRCSSVGNFGFIFFPARYFIFLSA